MTGRAIYPADAGERLKLHAGKPYRPSNGDEGDYFGAAWCRECRRNTALRACDDINGALDVVPVGCSILMRAMGCSIGDPEYPREWVYGADGQPCCTAFSDKHAPRPAYRCKATVDLFGATPARPETDQTERG